MEVKPSTPAMSLYSHFMIQVLIGVNKIHRLAIWACWNLLIILVNMQIIYTWHGQNIVLSLAKLCLNLLNLIILIYI